MKAIIALLLILCCIASAQAITIDTVPVGSAGNSNDPATGNLYGGVDYAYNIGKYEVTVGQYTAFLNAVAVADTYSLYDLRMATDLNVAGIARAGSSGHFAYTVIGSPNHPVTYVGWDDAARFANWIQTGQPTGAQNANTTEDGAYALNGATSSASLLSITRKANAKWFIPNENEWYKAAYYQPADQGGDSDGYWSYPMSTNDDPYSDQPAGTAPDNTRVGNFPKNDNTANSYDDGYAVTGSPSYASNQNYLTDVGAYALSSSYYGTFDQAGNVYEWTETVISNGPARVVRGGAWGGPIDNDISAGGRGAALLTPGGHAHGFRLAALAVPEPASLLLCLGGLVSFVSTARRR
jgi:formylglycine-generating enzyme required for sulfatase activity